MNFFKSIGILIVFAVYLVIGCALIALANNFIPMQSIIDSREYIVNNSNISLGVSVIGALFVLIGLINARVSLRRLKSSKTIAFENPDGQVVISLEAIEDYIKRIVKQLPQVRDLKSVVTANKKGITVTSRAAITSDSNIPEVTEKIQAIIKKKLLEMLGIEESICVRIHISKLISKGGKEEPEEDTETSRHIPLKGYAE